MAAGFRLPIEFFLLSTNFSNATVTSFVLEQAVGPGVLQPSALVL